MKYLLFLIILPYSTLSQQPAQSKFFTAIMVTNIDQSISWYSNSLGFELVDRVDSEERGFSIANLSLGEIHLELIQVSNTLKLSELLADDTKNSRVAGFFKVGFSIPDFDTKVEYLRKAQVKFHGSIVLDKKSGKSMVIIKDNEGNRIQLFEK